MKGNRLIIGALVAAVATVTGCTLTIDFDPRGVDVSLEGEWLINGGVADPVSCADAGIDQVQLVFYDGGVAYEFSEFRFNCEEGFFDTRPTPVLDHGRYQTQWLAYDATGGEIARSMMLSLDVSDFSVDHAILATVDFIVTGTPAFNPLGDVGILGATWTINGGAADATSCAAAGISTLQFVMYDETDTGYTDGVPVAEAPCEGGAFNSGAAILAAGSYLTEIVALDASGASVANYRSPDEFVITSPGTYELMAVDFEATAPLNEMTVNFTWGPAPATDCATAGVDSIFWALNDSTGTTVLDDATATCASVGDQLIFSDLPAGTYELFVDAESTDGLTKWQGTCTGLVHDGATTAFDCFYDLMP